MSQAKYAQNFGTFQKSDGVIIRFLNSPKNQKTLMPTDECTIKKNVARARIPLWNPKKSTLTIFRPPLSKKAMIMRLVLKTHVFHLE